MVRKVIKDNRGFTLTELLVSIVILGFITSACIGGMIAAFSARSSAIKTSDARILATTASQLISDELRYGLGIADSVSGDILTYDSQVYGVNVEMSLDADGRLVIDGKQLIGDGSYNDIRLSGLIFSSSSNGDISVYFEVLDDGGIILTTCEFNVKPINGVT